MKKIKTSKFLPFEQARELVRRQKLKSGREFKAWVCSENAPNSIPKVPQDAYLSEWQGIKNWLGTEGAPVNKKKFREFNEARKFVHGLSLSGKSAYSVWSKSGRRPEDIPASPKSAYGDLFKGWVDWLGTGTIYTGSTLAAGLITHSLRRAENIYQQAFTITKKERENLNGHSGKVIWFTGLSGAGKSTLANSLEVELHRQGKRTYILDGDNIRQGLNRDLGFTESDRIENIRRIAEVAKLMMDAGLIVMTAFISPFQREREMAKQLIGEQHFIEVYVDTPIEVCEKRDPKGLYQKARVGKLPNFSGISSPYEAPEKPDIRVDTSKHRSNSKAIQAILDLL
jgi:adenylyl-sulfate kinase